MKYAAFLGLCAALLLVACTTQDMGGAASDVDTRQNARDTVNGTNNTTVLNDSPLGTDSDGTSNTEIAPDSTSGSTY